MVVRITLSTTRRDTAQPQLFVPFANVVILWTSQLAIYGHDMVWACMQITPPPTAWLRRYSQQARRSRGGPYVYNLPVPTRTPSTR